MLGKNGFHIRIQQEKSYQNDELFFLGFEKVLKLQGSVVMAFISFVIELLIARYLVVRFLISSFSL